MAIELTQPMFKDLAKVPFQPATPDTPRGRGVLGQLFEGCNLDVVKGLMLHMIAGTTSTRIVTYTIPVCHLSDSYIPGNAGYIASVPYHILYTHIRWTY